MATLQEQSPQGPWGGSLYGFGDFTLDTLDRRLSQRGRSVHLMPKTYDVLVALIRRRGHLVTKRELLDAVWPQVFVAEGILTVHVAALRKALGDARGSPNYIETVSSLGYRFVAAVYPLPTVVAAPPEVLTPDRPGGFGKP